MHSRQVLCLDEHRSQRVRQDLTAAPDGLGHRATNQLPLQLTGDVGVDAVDALEFVVLKMVATKRHAIWDSNRPVGHHREELVVLRLLEEEVVGKLVNGKEEPQQRRRARNGRAVRDAVGRDVQLHEPFQGGEPIWELVHDAIVVHVQRRQRGQPTDGSREGAEAAVPDAEGLERCAESAEGLGQRDEPRAVRHLQLD